MVVFDDPVVCMGNHSPSGVLALYTTLSLLFCCQQGHLIFMPWCEIKHFNTFICSILKGFSQAFFVHPSRFGYSHCSFGTEVLSKNNGSLGRAFWLWWGRCKKRFDRRRWSWSIRRVASSWPTKTGGCKPNKNPVAFFWDTEKAWGTKMCPE